jgi:Zn-dependent protease
MGIEMGLFLYVVVILSAVFHEFMHGWMADQLGDPTAKQLGRLTLNPVKHIDPIGTLLLPLFMIFLAGGAFIGYAKPVPYNPYNLTDKKFGSTKVAFAGPAANFIIALLFSIVLRVVHISPFFSATISWVIYINILLALFNLIPVPPLDGSKLVMDLFPSTRFGLIRLSVFGIFFALIIAFWILPYITPLVYHIFAGEPFIPVRLF